MPNKGKQISSNRQKGKETVTALCQKYSVHATRQLVNRIMDQDPRTRMSDSDLIKAVTVINDRAYGKVVAPVEMKHTLDVSDEHLKAMQDYAKARLKGEEPKVIEFSKAIDYEEAG